MWSKTKTSSKAGFDKLYGWVDKLGAPVNRLSNTIGSEAFWPTTLNKESDKAARILKSFCKDGFYIEPEGEEERRLNQEGVSKGKQKVMRKIPSAVIRNAKGLAIFTTMRTGLWVSGAGGSGILVARLPDGSWSPPSGIMLHTAGLGFLVGVDIYDCVIVINDVKALDAFTNIRCTLGGDVSAVAGPVGIGGIVETELHKRQAPLFTYLKSRGLYAGVQVDGTVIIERTDENERFYKQKLPVKDILAGKVRHPPHELRTLMETLRAADGQYVDDELLPHDPPPGDYEIMDERDGQVFGIPAQEDPDPYGFLALQEQGLDIREAGTKEPASAEEFDFWPSSTSPVINVYRRSTDSRDVFRRSTDSRNALSGLNESRRHSEAIRRNSWRASSLSNHSRTTDSATQTDTEELEPRSPFSPTFPNGLGRSPAGSIRRLSIQRIPEEYLPALCSPPPLLLPRSNGSPVSPQLSPKALYPIEEPVKTDAEAPPKLLTTNLEVVEHVDWSEFDDDADDDYDGDDDAVVHSIKTATIPITPIFTVQAISKPRLVTVRKVSAPSLPPRNPVRDRKRLDSLDAAPVSPFSAASRSSLDVGTDKLGLAGEQSSEAAGPRTVAAASKPTSRRTGTMTDSRKCSSRRQSPRRMSRELMIIRLPRSQNETAVRCGNSLSV